MAKVDGTSQDALSRTIYAKRDGTDYVYPILSDADGNLKVNLSEGFDIPLYDEIALVYSGSTITTVVYKKSSVSVATISLIYSGSTLTNVVKT